MYNEYCLFCVELVNHAFERGELPYATHLMLQEKIVWLRDSMTGLFNLHYTVIPFCYIHLVSFLINGHLVMFAIAKGRLFTPESDILRGCVFPSLSAAFLSISCLGLIEIGGCVAAQYTRRLRRPIPPFTCTIHAHVLVHVT